jgi:hypothetical protein
MHPCADLNIYHSINTTLARISIALQSLDRYTQLSEQQRQFVNTALRGVADLDRILRDDAWHRLSEQPPAPNNTQRPGPA